jgi:hypothetical protein
MIFLIIGLIFISLGFPSFFMSIRGSIKPEYAMIGIMLIVVGAFFVYPSFSTQIQTYEVSNLTVQDACNNVLELNNISLKENQYLNSTVEDYNIICKIQTKTKEYGVIFK